MTALTFGVIGTGWITDSWIAAAQKSGKWQLSAVLSRSEANAQSYGAKHHCSNTYHDLDAFLADPDMQAVYVASPNSLHFAQAKQVLQAKKHCILEKPATSTPEELEELFQLAQRQDVFLIEAYRHIQGANYKLLRKLVMQEKRLGTIYGASFNYASYSSRYDSVLAGETPNIFSLDHSGGSLVDVGVYPVTFAVALFGEPKSQVFVPFICSTGVDAGGLIILRYEGFGVQVNHAKAYRSTAPSEIYGEKGTFTIDDATEVKTISHWDPKTKNSEELAGPYPKVEKPNVSMEEEATEFARIINEGDKQASAELERISKIVLRVTSDLRRQNGILYPADKK